MTLLKMPISEYVSKNCLKELDINTGKSLKNIAASNISKMATSQWSQWLQWSQSTPQWSLLEM